MFWFFFATNLMHVKLEKDQCSIFWGSVPESSESLTSACASCLGARISGDRHYVKVIKGEKYSPHNYHSLKHIPTQQ